MRRRKPRNDNLRLVPGNFWLRYQECVRMAHLHRLKGLQPQGPYSLYRSAPSPTFPISKCFKPSINQLHQSPVLPIYSKRSKLAYYLHRSLQVLSHCLYRSASSYLLLMSERSKSYIAYIGAPQGRYYQYRSAPSPILHVSKHSKSYIAFIEALLVLYCIYRSSPSPLLPISKRSKFVITYIEVP